MLLSVIIPAYNEEERIGSMLDQYLDFYHGKDIEFIVVVNNSTDKTLDIVKGYVQKYPQKIHFINIDTPIGKGGAVKRGFAKAQGDLISFVDADASTEPREFDKVVKAVNGADGAIASRWKKGSHILNGNPFREVISIGFIAFVKLLFWMPFVDTQCGAKVFKKELIQKILPKLRVDNMAFDVELLHSARRAGFSIVEVPTRWTDNSSSSAVLGTPTQVIAKSIKMFITIVRIRFNR